MSKGTVVLHVSRPYGFLRGHVWETSSDPDVKIAKMKEGRTHPAHEAEHALDLDTGALVAVTLQAPTWDTTSLIETAIMAGGTAGSGGGPNGAGRTGGAFPRHGG